MLESHCLLMGLGCAHDVFRAFRGETPFSESARGVKLAVDDRCWIVWIGDLADQVEVGSPF